MGKKIKMDIENIKEKIKKSLHTLHEEDNHILKHNGSERSIAHCLAYHLSELFDDYKVDCEYNLNIENGHGKKTIELLEEKLKKCDKNLTHRYCRIIGGKKFYSVSVFPDIIIHQRGTNDYNLLAIEIKKSTSRIPHDYDYCKLAHYTNSTTAWKYKHGCFIKIHTNLTSGYKFEVVFFEDGEEKKEEILILEDE